MDNTERFNMVMSFPRAIGIKSAQIDNKTQDLVLTFKGESGSDYEVKIHPGVVGNVTAALITVGAQAKTKKFAKGSQTNAQVTHITGSQIAIGPQGQPILELILEGSVPFRVTFPPEAIPLLQKSLLELQDATTLKSQKKH